KIVTVTNGVDTSRFRTPFDRAAFRRSLGLAGDEALVGYIGRMWPQKDPRTFVEAARLIADERPKVRCLFLGDGPLLDETAALAARARRRFEEEFTEERMLRDTFALYEKLLLKKCPRPHPTAAAPAVP